MACAVGRRGPWGFLVGHGGNGFGFSLSDRFSFSPIAFAALELCVRMEGFDQISTLILSMACSYR